MIPKPKLSKTKLMIDCYLTNHQYEAGTGLGKHGDWILALIEKTPLLVWGSSLRNDINATMAKKRENDICKRLSKLLMLPSFDPSFVNHFIGPLLI